MKRIIVCLLGLVVCNGAWGDYTIKYLTPSKEYSTKNNSECTPMKTLFFRHDDWKDDDENLYTSKNINNAVKLYAKDSDMLAPEISSQGYLFQCGGDCIKNSTIIMGPNHFINGKTVSETTVYKCILSGMNYLWQPMNIHAKNTDPLNGKDNTEIGYTFLNNGFDYLVPHSAFKSGTFVILPESSGTTNSLYKRHVCSPGYDSDTSQTKCISKSGGGADNSGATASSEQNQSGNSKSSSFSPSVGQPCSSNDPNATSGHLVDIDGQLTCVPKECKSTHEAKNNKCVKKPDDKKLGGKCTADDLKSVGHAITGKYIRGQKGLICAATECDAGHKVFMKNGQSQGYCVATGAKEEECKQQNKILEIIDGTKTTLDCITDPNARKEGTPCATDDLPNYAKSGKYDANKKCIAETCDSVHHVENGECVINPDYNPTAPGNECPMSKLPDGAETGVYGENETCIPTACKSTHTLTDNTCVAKSSDTSDESATTTTTTTNNTTDTTPESATKAMWDDIYTLDDALFNKITTEKK